MKMKTPGYFRPRGIGAAELGGTPEPVHIEPLLVPGRFARLKGFLLRAYGYENERGLSADLGICPLRFKNRKLEKKFCNDVSSRFRLRCCLACLAGLIVVCALWIGTSFSIIHSPSIAAIEADLSPQTVKDLDVLFAYSANVMTVSRVIEVVLYILIALVPFVPCLSNSAKEKLVYFIFFMMQISSTVCTSCVIAKGSFIQIELSEANLLLSKDLVRSSTNLMEAIMELFFYVTLATLVFPLVSLDLIMHSRTYWTWILHLGYVGLTTILCLLERDDFNAQGWNEEAFCVTKVCISFAIGAVLFFGRMTQELRERVEYHNWTVHKLKLMEINAELEKSRVGTPNQPAGLESKLEELIGMLRQAEVLLQIGIKNPPTEILDSSLLISQVLRTMLNHGNDLFQLRFYDLSKEGESIIDHYVRNIGSGSKTNPPEPRNDLHAAELSAEKKKKRHDTKQVMRNHPPMDMTGVSPPTSSRGPQWSGSRISVEEDTQVPDLNTLIAQVNKTRGIGREWNFDILKLAEVPDVRVLVHVGAALLVPSAQCLDVSPTKILQFLCTMEKCYWANPYHNKAHAAEVAHTACCLLFMSRLSSGAAYTPLAHVALSAAALGHDVGHPSRNNNFFINTFDPLAIIYNDISVLENYHAFLTFQILHDDGSDIFQQVLLDEYKNVRKRIIEMILATDMKQHFESISKFRIRRCAEDFDMFNNSEDMWHTIRMLMKGADLSHASVVWPQHFEWSCRIQEEFYQQGDEEALLCMPKSPLCDRSTHSGFSKSQKGFLEFVVLPLFLELEAADPEGEVHSICTIQLLENKETWSKLDTEGTYIHFPPHVQEIKTLPQLRGLPSAPSATM